MDLLLFPVTGSSAVAQFPLSIHSQEEKSKHELSPVFLNCFLHFLACFSKDCVLLQCAYLSSCPSDF